jgi:hypothetical protein
MRRRLFAWCLAFSVSVILASWVPAVIAAPPSGHENTTRVIVAPDDDENFDIGSLGGTLGGALVGGVAAIFGGIKAAQLQERSKRGREHHRSAEEERRRQAADVRRLVGLCTDAVAALPPFEDVSSLKDIDPECRHRAENAIIEAGGIHPFVADRDVKVLAKGLLEEAATVVGNDTLTPTVRRTLIASAKQHHRQLQKQAQSVYEALVALDAA